MKIFAAGLLGLLVGAALGVFGLMWLHHHSPFRDGRHTGHHGGHHDREADTAAAPAAAATSGEKPAYLIVLGEVYDREKFIADYTAKLPPLYEKFGGEYLAVGRNFEVFEGTGNFKSFVVSKWPSMAAANAFWTSSDYDALRRARIDGNWGRFDVYALEGLPEPATTAAPAPAESAPK